RGERRDIRRHYVGRGIRGGIGDRQRSARWIEHSLHARGYRRTLSEHAAVRGRTDGHDRRGVGDLALDTLRSTGGLIPAMTYGFTRNDRTRLHTTKDRETLERAVVHAFAHLERLE